MNIDAKTRLYLLIGNPVAHSLSPTLHNAAFKSLGMNSLYLAANVESAEVGAAVKGLKALSIGGANVTSPHKEAVLKYLDNLSTEAKLIKSVNTIVNNKGFLAGFTTDGSGFYRSLLESVDNYEPDWPVMIVGAGGAARAVAYAIANKAESEIYIVNRSVEKAKTLAEFLETSSPLKKCKVVDMEEKSIEIALNKCRLIIYSLPLDSPALIAALGNNPGILSNSFLFDLRYNPARTKVMEAFERAGGRSFNGLGMLFWQAAEAFELFTGEQAPLENMKKAIALQIESE
ncbi:MAG: shikimate dehydrogenase [Bacillota bacterium]|nr:shikimate dehydrogenase [Bacillota bacterium]MDW7728834.1 shikimate dehydrogenase [Bacillota bacterium]